jgi:glutathione S-transferase
MTELRLVGSSVSPYTRKVRALLRYRRIPYQFVRAGGRESEALPSAPLPLIPYVVLPDQNGELTEAMADTTPIINRLEDDYPERAVRPMDPALAVIDALLEEFGDELCHEYDRHTRGGGGVCQDVCRAADFPDWCGGLK